MAVEKVRIVYTHFRAYDSEGELLPNGGATVGLELKDSTYRTAVAFCSPKDNYCKKVGRNIVNGRLSCERDRALPSRSEWRQRAENQNLHELSAGIAKQTLVEIRLKRSVKKWLQECLDFQA